LCNRLISRTDKVLFVPNLFAALTQTPCTEAKEELAPKAVDAITDSAGRAAKVTADAVSHIRDAAKKAV
jgi:hypothetical protein